jgi:protein-L-isoaspartate(D-aspartate) O-methyltransferase
MVERQLRRRGVTEEAVLEAMLKVPRHCFVAAGHLRSAYADKALPTAEGQTISQPYMVALMTESLMVRAGLKILEIGTGSGYQTALLAHMGGDVLSVERSATLAESAKWRLQNLGYGDSTRIVVGDGTRGWPREAPYDRILVTAGAPRVPAAYREQLVDGGRIVIPLGDRSVQQLTILECHGDQWTRTQSTACRFVPLIGEDGWGAASDGATERPSGEGLSQ